MSSSNELDPTDRVPMQSAPLPEFFIDASFGIHRILDRIVPNDGEPIYVLDNGPVSPEPEAVAIRH